MKHLSNLIGACLSTALLTACGGNGGVSPSSMSGMTAPVIRPATNMRGAQESVIYTFQGGSDGGSPYAGLLVGANGDLYGATWDSTVKADYGTVFQLTPSGVKTVLYTFQGGTDAANPQGGVIAGTKGVLLGDTVYGGGATTCTGGCGTVYELTPNGSGYSERVLYAFQGGNDGAGPVGTLLAKNGTLYGTTVDGGGSLNCTGPSGFTGCGTAFKLTPSGSGYTETVIYTFQGGNDGAGPRGGLITKNNALYGTTQFGGKGTACTGGCGTVFRLTPSGSTYKERVLYSFNGGTSDGDAPRSALVAGKNGTLIGTTTRGGLGGGPGGGAVFELTPSGSKYTEHVLYFFLTNGSKDGAVPFDENGLYADASGDLFGTTIAGGTAACGCGTLFKLTPSGSGYIENILHSFSGSNGNDPRAAPVADKNGTLYGTTFSGAKKVKGCTSGCGVVYEASP
ncbi:MAG: choice-of-anchor tandem repeat GloVer-containing protein [Candidatus Tumulicola sp.]